LIWGFALSKHTWRDPGLVWQMLRVAYVAAIALYLFMLLLEVVTLGAYVGWISLSYEQATLLDEMAVRSNNYPIIVFIVCGSLTIALTYRLAANSQNQNPGLASASYVIPFLNFVMPPIVIGQIWRDSFANSVAPQKPNGRIGAWWAAYLGATFTGLYLRRYTGGVFDDGPSDIPLEDIGSVVAVSALGFFCRIVAASTLLWIFGTLVKQQRTPSLSEAFV
jgi:hypothetical protein